MVLSFRLKVSHPAAIDAACITGLFRIAAGQFFCRPGHDEALARFPVDVTLNLITSAVPCLAFTLIIGVMTHVGRP